MSRHAWIFFAVLLAGVFAIIVTAMQRNAPVRSPAPADPMQLQVYNVPPARAEDIRDALSGALSMPVDDAPLGKVSLSGGNQLMVLAPGRIHSGVRSAIESIGGPEAARPAIVPVRLEVWLVDAQPGRAADDPALAPIAEALQSTRTHLGEVGFVRYDALSMVGSTRGDSIDMRSGRGTRVGARLRGIDGGVYGQIEIGGDAHAMKTATELPFGQTLVLAELASETAGGAMRLYVVRASAPNAAP
jgi:hypothetical protein